LKTLFVVTTAIAAALGFALLLCSTAGPFRAVTGQGVTAAEANARLWNCLVPDSATDVWYTSAYRATQIECRLYPTTFMEWCQRMKWRPIPITAEPYYCYSEKDKATVVITVGVYFNALNGDLGYYGVYDAKKQRAYVTYSGG